MSRKIRRTHARSSPAADRSPARDAAEQVRLPTDPLTTASRTDWCAGSKRLLNLIWNGTPASRTASSARSTSTRSCDTGFSQKIALPDSAAAAISGACVSVLEQIATASTSERPISSSALPATATPSSSPSACRLRARVVHGRHHRTWHLADRRRARHAPIRPTPITPIRSALMSVLPQRHDVLPAAALGGPKQRARTPTASASSKPRRCWRRATTERQNSKSSITTRSSKPIPLALPARTRR